MSALEASLSLAGRVAFAIAAHVLQPIIEIGRCRSDGQEAGMTIRSTACGTRVADCPAILPQTDKYLRHMVQNVAFPSSVIMCRCASFRDRAVHAKSPL